MTNSTKIWDPAFGTDPLEGRVTKLIAPPVKPKPPMVFPPNCQIVAVPRRPPPGFSALFKIPPPIIKDPELTKVETKTWSQLVADSPHFCDLCNGPPVVSLAQKLSKGVYPKLKKKRIIKKITK